MLSTVDETELIGTRHMEFIRYEEEQLGIFVKKFSAEFFDSRILLSLGQS